jgi:hypothetical protein
MPWQQEFEPSGLPLEYQGTDYLPCKKASRSSLVKPASLSSDKSVLFGIYQGYVWVLRRDVLGLMIIDEVPA